MDKPQLYRVRVLRTNPKTENEESIDVTPALVQEAAKNFCDAIVMQIRLGKERTWRDPVVYPVYV